ncbi:MAG: DUF1493 family protein [Crocinitomix sp.]|nr:DUF1493 family protein [Crocinitomix sp.]
MNPSKIEISYTELKSVYSQVLSFVHKEAPWDKNTNATTQIENDLELIGWDNESFFESFSNKFTVDFSQMEYAEYFDPEMGPDLESVFHFFVFLPLFVLKTFIFLLFWPFSSEIASKIRNFSFIANQENPKKDVTIGDLVVSVIQKRFSERRDFKIELKR